MAAKKYIQIKKGKIGVNDHLDLAVGALKFGLLLHISGLAAIPLFAGKYLAINGWLIIALGFFVIGTVSAASSLGAVMHLSCNVQSGLYRAWNEHANGKLVSEEILSFVAPFYPKLSDPGPVFGFVSATSLAAGWGIAVVGMQKILAAVAKAL